MDRRRETGTACGGACERIAQSHYGEVENDRHHLHDFVAFNPLGTLATAVVLHTSLVLTVLYIP